jgi:hypothetical protein
MKRALLLVLAAGCSTIGSSGQGDVDLPSSGVGPFRKLGQSEVPGVDPFVLDNEVARFREPDALALDDDPTSTRVALFVVAHDGDHDVIVKTHADDARSFYGTSADVPSHKPLKVVDMPGVNTRGVDVSGPSAIRVGGEIRLYFAGPGGIWLTRSLDGVLFPPQSAPVFARDAMAPSVAQFPDGSFHMLYVSGGNIWEAKSDDGTVWQELDGPVLSPSEPATNLAPGEKPPFDTYAVSDPVLLPRMTPAGRLQVRVLYTGYDGPPGEPGTNSTIGFAARYGDTGTLSRQSQPVYSVGKHEAAPGFFAWSGGEMLYVQQDKTTSTASAGVVPAIAGAVGPATLTLGPPAPFPDSP